MFRSDLGLAGSLVAASACFVLGCGGSHADSVTRESAPSASPAPVAPAPEPASPAPTVAPSPTPTVARSAAPLPSTFDPTQGQTAHGVYLARVSSGDDAEARRVLDALRARGVTAGSAGELSCDQGAATALHLPEDTIAVSVDFRTHEDAARFADLWGAPVLGVAEFVAFCRD